MNTAFLLASVNTSWLPTLPSFDWNAAIIVGIIVAIGAVLVIVAAIATPVVAIQGGATTLGTTLAVTLIGVVTGALAGSAAGFYWGREGDLKRAEQLVQIMKVSSQLDIYFEPKPEKPKPGEPREALDSTCTIVTYEEQGANTKAPGVNVKKQQIKALSPQELIAETQAKIQEWLSKNKISGHDGSPRRRVTFFMKPFPGQTFFLAMKPFCEEQGCVVSSTDSTWVSALDR